MSEVSSSLPGIQSRPIPADRGGALPWGRLRGSLPLVVILIIGLAASFGTHILTKEWDRQNREKHFGRLAQEQILAIQSKILTTVSTLRSIRGLFNASDTVDRDEFHAFVDSLEVADAVQALEWIPRVPQAQRSAYEQRARQEVAPDFAFTERGSEGMVRAGDRDEYFPVYFVDPYVGNEQALGFDLGSNATRRAALDSARASGRAVATARITLVQETGEQFGFLIFIPVYRDGAMPEAAGEREANLKGFGLGVFRIGDLVSSAQPEGQDAATPIEIHVFDRSAPPGAQLLYPKAARVEDASDLRSPLRIEAALQFATRNWLIVATPGEGSLFTRDSFTPWLVLLFGMVITGLTAFSFKVVLGRTDYANQLVTFRTAELVRSTEERERILLKLTKTNEELESFAYVASHDLKSPLRGIDNLVSWIVEDPDSRLSEESQHNAGRLRARVNRLEALLDGLLEYSRAGRVKAEVETVDTGHLCAQITEYLAPPEGFTISIAPDLPVLDTVKAALEAVLRNLMSNAVKHHDRDAGRIEVSADDLGEAYRFTVRDDGPGIDPAFHDRVFEIFQTLAPRSKVDSSGIGLSIVKRIVESAGGSLGVESSAEGRGTAFHFTWKKNWPNDGD